MLFVRPKISELALRVFGRSVHPELFEFCASRQIEREHYLLTAQITTSGHVLSFRHHSAQIVEVCAGIHQELPQQQCLVSQSIQHEHDQACRWEHEMTWRSSFQCEPVDPSLFQAIEEHVAPLRHCEGLIHRFQSSGRLSIGAISYVSIQSFRRHALVRVFHTFPDAGTVVKSQTRFSLPPL
ncbi:MAG TPA: DUF2617 family protein [Pirellulaceae bacterium]|nr:DUF2617 family protein [Pirellulaceae bacterium]